MKKISPAKEKTRRQQDAFIAEYMRNGHNVEAACRVVKLNKTTFYRWKKIDPDFCARMDDRIEAKEEVKQSVVERFGKLADAAIEFCLKYGEPADRLRAALRIKEVTEPELWDAGLRKELLLKKKEADRTTPKKIMLHRGKAPARLLTEEQKKTGTEE